MSRWIESKEVAGRIVYKETIASMDECIHLCNEVCCNDRCDQLAEFVDTEYCRRCPRFEKEDGIIIDPEHHTE